MRVDPIPALRERLVMGVERLHLIQIADGAPEQIMMHRQLQLRADGQRRFDKHIERMVDTASGRILDRDDAEVGTTLIDLRKDLGDRPQRYEFGSAPEAFERGSVRK